MSETLDNFIRPPFQDPVCENKSFIRLERSSLRYYLDDACLKLHRTDGPAVIHNNGCIEYWNFGQLHNISGPAIRTPIGTEVYYLFGRRLDHKKWLYWKERYSLDNSDTNSVIKVHENNWKAGSSN